jgi:hypothetical protein
MSGKPARVLRHGHASTYHRVSSYGTAIKKDAFKKGLDYTDAN